MASLETGRGERRHRGQLDGLLAHPVGGSRFDPEPQLVPAVVAELPGEHRRRAGPPGDRLDHQAVQVGEHVSTAFLVAAPPGGHRRQQEGLAEEVLGQPGKVGQQARVLEYPTAEGVDDGHSAEARRLD